VPPTLPVNPSALTDSTGGDTPTADTSSSTDTLVDPGNTLPVAPETTANSSEDSPADTTAEPVAETTAATAEIAATPASTPPTTEPGIVPSSSEGEPPNSKASKDFLVGPNGITDMGTSYGPGQVVRARMVRSISSPREIDNSLGQIVRNSLLGLLLMLLVALPSEIFNSTLKAHEADVAGHVSALHRRLKPIEDLLVRIPNSVSLVFFASVAAVLWAVVDPAFGANRTTGALLLGLTGAIFVVTGVSMLVRAAFLKRRYQLRGKLKTLPIGIVLAGLLIVMSRVAHFSPGYLFGIFATLAFAHSPSQKQSGRAVVVASLATIGVAFAAWLVWMPVKSATIAGHGGFGLLVLDALLSNLWVWSLQAIIFGLIPLKYLDGEDVVAWSRAGWLALYGFVMFLFVHTVMHPTTLRYGSNPDANITSMLYLFIGFMSAAVAFWLYFRIRSRRKSRRGPAVTG
jgi:hypothetical protein